MPLIRSISGFRGTIGAGPGEGLNPPDIVNAVSAFASILLQGERRSGCPLVVLGRDARPSGAMVRDLTAATLRACGIDVLDLGLSTTPTVEMAVIENKALGGIVLTASHNPIEWNALKFLNGNGEFISWEMGKELIERSERGAFSFEVHQNIGEFREMDASDLHIRKITELAIVDTTAIRDHSFKVVVDGVDSSGGLFVPKLLKALGVDDIIELNCEPTGHFAHDPEPLPENLEELSTKVLEENADLGIAVDPDVDRLAFIDENGEPFGEEYTLVAVADHVLRQKKGNSVSNLSSSRALKDITEKHGGTHYASAVGELNVVQRMKEVQAMIGGEGNGGVILPELHYGRDALVGIALFLTLLAKSGKTCSELRNTYPDYFMAKERARLDPKDDVEALLERVADRYKEYRMNKEDGLKIEFEHEWVHMRRSNTEPIVRVYTESRSPERAKELADNTVEELKGLIEEIRSIEN